MKEEMEENVKEEEEKEEKAEKEESHVLLIKCWGSPPEQLKSQQDGDGGENLIMESSGVRSRRR